MIKYFSLLLLFNIILVSVYSQESSDEPNDCIYIYDSTKKSVKYYGGNKKLLDDIQKNLIYPKTQAYITCRVYVSFTIDSTGKLVNPKIVKGYNNAFDNEALRVVKLLGKWKPGEVKGKKVNSKYVLPIRFD